MPELPEVEVIRRGLQSHLPGREVFAVKTGNRKLRLPMPRRDLKRYILAKRIKAVGRRAKFLVITMNNGARLIIHLGMTGRLGIFPTGSPRAKHDHLRLQLDNNMELRFNDTRRFGSIQVLPPGVDPSTTMLVNCGPEPLGRNLSPGYLRQHAAGKNRPLKIFLMDNRIVVGIGNIYASEILFHAGLHPEKKISKLSRKEWANIVAGSRHILQKAIASGGTTVSDFVNASGKSGYFQLELQTYGRQGKPCKICANPIVRKTMAGRATFYCPICQK